MTLTEIKTAIAEGKKVFWSNGMYQVIKDRNDHYLIKCSSNGYCTGLTHQDGLTMNEKEEDFFIQK